MTELEKLICFKPTKSLHFTLQLSNLSLRLFMFLQIVGR